MGQEGHSLLFLTPSETSYVEFLRLNKGLALQSYPCPTAPCLRDRARTIICQDRCEFVVVKEPIYLVI